MDGTNNNTLKLKNVWLLVGFIIYHGKNHKNEITMNKTVNTPNS